MNSQAAAVEVTEEDFGDVIISKRILRVTSRVGGSGCNIENWASPPEAKGVFALR